MSTVKKSGGSRSASKKKSAGDKKPREKKQRVS
jgi:hypothetical protein